MERERERNRSQYTMHFTYTVKYTEYLHHNNDPLTSSKKLSSQVVQVLRCKPSLGVRVEEAVESFRDTGPWDTVWYYERFSILCV